MAAVAAFVASAIWYISLGGPMARLQAVTRDGPTRITKAPGWKRVAEFGREIVIAFVLAHVLVLVGVADWAGAVQLGLWLWVGFPVVLLVGSVMYEDVPWKLAAIHSGDWLVKLVLMSLILGLWR